MNKLFITELECVIHLNSESDYRDNRSQISILLKEFARRLLLCGESISKKGINLSLSTNIIFDAVGLVLGRNFASKSIIANKLGQNSERCFSFFDEYVLSAYFNWEVNKREMLSLGYSLSNPYRPYLEVLKLGGFGLKYESPVLEVFPFIRIVLSPRSDYMQDLSFWNGDLIISDSEEE